MARSATSLRPDQRGRGRLLGRARLVLLLAVLFSSPDDKQITMKSWSSADPVDFAQTAITELDGTSGTAGYAPPTTRRPARANTSARSRLRVGSGCRSDRHGAGLRGRPARDPAQQSGACRRGERVHLGLVDQQAAWTAAYEKAVAKATTQDGQLVVPAGDYGPVGPMITGLTAMAQSGSARLGDPLVGPVLRHRLHEALPLPRRRYLFRQISPRHAISVATSGMMNETGASPAKHVVALHHVVPDPPFNSLGER